MPGCLDRCDGNVLKQVYLLTIFHYPDIFGELKYKRLTVILRKIEFVAQQGFQPHGIGIDGHVMMQSQQLIQSVDMVKMGMSEQYAAQTALDERKNLIQVTAVNNP